MILCQRCGKENNEDASFCQYCGTKLAYPKNEKGILSEDGQIGSDLNKGFNLNFEHIVDFTIVILVITDTFLLLLSDLSNLTPNMINNINHFDLLVCLVLFCDFSFRLNKANNKKEFLKDKYNILTLISMIPVSFFAFRLLRYVKVIPLILPGLKRFNKFLEETHLNWSFGILILAISAGTILFYFLEHGINKQVPNLWDAFLYVLPTVATEGSAISPKTVGGEILGLILMITGIICFGLFTAAIASKFIKSDDKEDDKEDLDKLRFSVEKLEHEMKGLKELLKENR